MMQEENRCSGCKHGRHKKHLIEFENNEGQTVLCQCKVCVPEKRK